MNSFTVPIQFRACPKRRLGQSSAHAKGLLPRVFFTVSVVRIVPHEVFARKRVTEVMSNRTARASARQ